MYDKDVVGSDDFMGGAEFDLVDLDLNKSLIKNVSIIN